MMGIIIFYIVMSIVFTYAIFRLLSYRRKLCDVDSELYKRSTILYPRIHKFQRVGILVVIFGFGLNVINSLINLLVILLKATN